MKSHISERHGNAFPAPSLLAHTLITAPVVDFFFFLSKLRREILDQGVEEVNRDGF